MVATRIEQFFLKKFGPYIVKRRSKTFIIASYIIWCAVCAYGIMNIEVYFDQTLFYNSDEFHSTDYTKIK